MRKIMSSAFISCLLIVISMHSTFPTYANKSSQPLTILMLHHFTTDPSATNNTTIEMNTLEYKLLAYQQAGYTFVKLGETNAVEKPIILSIDDGYASVYTQFYPLAKRLQIPFNLNLIMSRIGTTSDKEIPKCTLAQLKEMQASGLCQLGVHSYDSHGLSSREGLVQLPNESWTTYQEAINTDTEKAVSVYKQLFGEAPVIYAYPYGSFNDYTQKMLKDKGFKYTLTTMYGFNAIDEFYTLRRINVNMHHKPLR